MTEIRFGAGTAGSSDFSIGLGIFTGQIRPGSGIGVAQEYRATVAMAKAAEAFGFESIWLSEHHGADDAYLPSPLPMLAAIAAVTERIRLGTAVLLPSFWHPIHLAEDVAVIDQLSEGRVILGLGLGWREVEFRSFGVRRSERAGRTAEMVAILRRLWSGDPSPFAGKYYQFEEMRVRPLPYRAGGPPIYLAGSHEKAVRRSAAISDGLIYSLSGPTAAAVQPNVERLEAALAVSDDERKESAAGPALPLVLLLNVFVARGDPWAAIAEGVDHHFINYARWKKEDAGVALTAEDERQAVAAGRNLLLVGEPQTVTDRLGVWIDAIAPQRPLQLVVKLHYPGVNEDRTIEAMDLFSREVMPALRERARHAARSGGNTAASR